jgi:hypothetical protein
MKFLFLPIFCFLYCFGALFARETCSRTATINYQEILVDSSSTQKGEGLRFYLEKDTSAKSYLDMYQNGAKLKWQNAAMGTLGTAFVLGGLVTNNRERKQTFIIAGFSLIAINFLIAKTFEVSNEDNLLRAIEEYNKRNYPKIYFAPVSYEGALKFDLALSKDWSF